MKFLKLILILLISIVAISCSSDDDICTKGEGTPRLKMKFKDSNNKLIQLGQIYIDVDYGSGSKNVVSQTKADSIVIPLRVDGSGQTDLQIYTDPKGAKSTVRINYTEESVYVSPACGIRKLYKDVKSALVNPLPVKSIEQNQPEIINENKTHLYLIF